MKKLFIIRDAKSSWSDMSLDDFDRPLNKRGKKDAQFMGRLLRDDGIYPDIIISSPAKRAKKTAMAIASEIGYKKEIDFDANIYGTSVDKIDAKIKTLKDDISTAFLFGHNPHLNILANLYVGFDENIVTCGILEIEFVCDSWSDIDASNAQYISYKYPKKYR